jgi:hypothetical protein
VKTKWGGGGENQEYDTEKPEIPDTSPWKRNAEMCGSISE